MNARVARVITEDWKWEAPNLQSSLILDYVIQAAQDDQYQITYSDTIKDETRAFLEKLGYRITPYLDVLYGKTSIISWSLED